MRSLISRFQIHMLVLYPARRTPDLGRDYRRLRDSKMTSDSADLLSFRLPYVFFLPSFILAAQRASEFLWWLDGSAVAFTVGWWNCGLVDARRSACILHLFVIH